MEKLKLYTVIKSSTDGTIKVGDIVWLSENDDLNIAQCKMWVTKDEWNNPKTKDFEVEPCDEYYLDVVYGHEIVRKIKRKDIL